MLLFLFLPFVLMHPKLRLLPFLLLLLLPLPLPCILVSVLGFLKVSSSFEALNPFSFMQLYLYYIHIIGNRLPFWDRCALKNIVNSLPQRF